jgi:predicted TPR repeat methyltransferase
MAEPKTSAASPLPAALLQAKALYEAGLAAAELERWAEAVSRFDDALALAPGRPSVLAARGSVRQRVGDNEAALHDLDAALAADAALFHAWCHRGLALAELGALDSALASFERALALDPQHAGAALEHAALLARLGRHDTALTALDALVQREPNDVATRLERARLLARLGRPADALRDCAAATALAPGLAPAWTLQGQVLRDLNRGPAALAAFDRALALGADRELNGYFAASLLPAAGSTAAHPAPPQAPRSYVKSLFDGYGPGFERHLLHELKYRAHDVLAALLMDAAGPGHRFASALDLGCGTGLLGLRLKPMVDRLAGVDLSPAMLALARRHGVYDRLVEAELHEHLAAETERHELIVATDVFIYIGSLEPVFASVARRLEPGGWFGFSCERLDDDSPAATEPGWALRSSLRYAQSESHLLALAERHGLALGRRLQAPLREENGQPVDGLYLVLQAPVRPAAG